MALEQIKLILGVTDSDRDELLLTLYEYGQNAIMVYTGLAAVPAALEWIADELTVIRFNRLTAEGLTEEKIENLTTKYTSDILGPYSQFLDEYMRNNATESNRGRLRML